MRKAPVSILKARLSQYLAAVKSGEEVIVTEHGTPIARISPIVAAQSLDERMAMLIREGRVRPPTARAASLRSIEEQPRDATGLSLEYLLEERREGR
jgi:prevent-host-death family protein